MTVRTKVLVRGLLLAGVAATLQLEGHARQQPSSPNILFILLDDVGKDQLAMFNPAAGTAALTPNLNAIGAGGVRFTNVFWPGGSQGRRKIHCDGGLIAARVSGARRAVCKFGPAPSHRL